MTKQELVAAMAEATGVSKKQADENVEAFCGIITVSLAEGAEITLPGIGKFSVVQKAARTGRNPKTGEAVKIAARRAPKFSASKVLKDALNVKAAKGKKK